jgi:hypothetical protein
MAGGGSLTRYVVLGAALVTAPGAWAQADHLECYKLRDALGKTRYAADLAGLAAEPGCVVKTPAKLLCVPTVKTNVAPTPPGAPAGSAAGAFLCYKATCRREALPSRDVSDQFGARVVRPKVTKLLCAPATVTGPTTTTTIPATLCCQGLGGPICSDRPADTAEASCGGTVAAAGQVCDGATGSCADARTGVSTCCQVPGPLCFEGPLAALACAVSGAVVVPGAACLPSGACVVP